MNRRTRRVAAVGGLAAQFLFVVAWLFAPLWQGPRYNVIAHSISDMYAETAPAGLILVVVFTVCGAVTIVLLWLAIWPKLRSAGWTTTVATILLTLSIFGLGDLLTPFERLACRLADPGCTATGQLSNSGGMLDADLSTVGVALFVAGAIFLAIALTKVAGWERYFVPLLVLAILTFLFFVADGVLASAGLSGLFERLLALSGALTLGWLAIRVIRSP